MYAQTEVLRILLLVEVTYILSEPSWAVHSRNAQLCNVTTILLHVVEEQHL
jgi:hypothetical protein